MTKDVVSPRLGSSDDSDEVTLLRWLEEPGTQLRRAAAYWKSRRTRSMSRSNPLTTVF